MFIPKLEILPAPQLKLWHELVSVPPEFVLYGGTAVALYLGHRQSIDFDFFAMGDIDNDALYSDVPFLENATIIQQQKNTLVCLVDRGAPVKVSFFGVPRLRVVYPPLLCSDNNLKVASLVDLAGMKASVVQRRSEAKDYLDIDALLQAGVNLPTALAAATAIYGKNFNPQITLKALCYFDDGDVYTLSEAAKMRLIVAVKATDLSALPKL